MKSGTRQLTDAVYRKGVLEPLQTLDLEEEELVRLVVEKVTPTPPPNRAALLARLRDGIAQMDFRSKGPYPSREQLHDRH